MATIVLVGYNAVQKHAIEVSMQSDLDTASSTLESTKHGTESLYPADQSAINSGKGLVKSGTNVLTYTSIGTAYCVEATSPRTDKVYHYLSTVGRVKDGPCEALETDDPETVTTLIAGLNYPTGIATGSTEFVYVAETYSNRILKITSAGVASVFAGSTSGASGSGDGMGTAARFNRPHGLAVDASGNVYVADTENQTIRRITPAGSVSTIAGTVGATGTADGPGLTTARFYDPYVVAVDPATGEVYVTETGNHRIRKISSSNTVSTIAGAAAGYNNGTGTAARFDEPLGMAFYGPIMYVAEYDNHTIRTVTKLGVVDTVFGARTAGLVDSNGQNARFNKPSGVSVRGSTLYIADSYNHRVRTANLVSGAVSTYAGSGTNGSQEGDVNSAQFSYPTGVAASPNGTVYVVETNAGRVRAIQ